MSAPSTEQITRISIHVLREEGDCPPRLSRPQIRHFYPRPPRGGRLQQRLVHSGILRISIHALREEGDSTRWIRWHSPIYFYPRPPRGGRPSQVDHPPFHLIHFYPRPPRGGRHRRHIRRAAGIQFLSTPSARRATPRVRVSPDALRISIHALREEGDDPSSYQKDLLRNFYPRPPRGGRPGNALPTRYHPEFLSTPSARRATLDAADQLIVKPFLSTPSARRATQQAVVTALRKLISIHALREEGDARCRGPAHC